MDKKRIVVALGRNAFGETFPEQQANVKKAAKAIADLVEAKYQIVITHSNGPPDSGRLRSSRSTRQWSSGWYDSDSYDRICKT